MQHNAVADDTYLGAVGNLALQYIAAGNEQLGNSNQLTHLYAALYNLFEFGCQHTLNSGLYIVQSVIDYAIGTHVNLFGFSSLASVSIGTNVEADNERISCRSQHNVGLSNSANAGMYNNNLNLIVLNLLQGSLQCFNGALYVSLNNDVQLFNLTLLNALEQVIQGYLGVKLNLLFLLLGNTFFSNATSSFLVGAV